MTGSDFVNEARDYMALVDDLKTLLHKKWMDGPPKPAPTQKSKEVVRVKTPSQ